MSQLGLTVYPLSGDQIRTLARVQLEFEFLLDQNRSMAEMLSWCDSIEAVQSSIIYQKDLQLQAKDEMLNARQQQYMALDAKFLIAEQQVKRERRKKNLYFTITLAALGVAVFLFISGS